MALLPVSDSQRDSQPPSQDQVLRGSPNDVVDPSLLAAMYGFLLVSPLPEDCTRQGQMQNDDGKDITAQQLFLIP